MCSERAGTTGVGPERCCDAASGERDSKDVEEPLVSGGLSCGSLEAGRAGH